MDTRVHISLEVSDLNKSVAFYSALFQREPTKIQADYANFRMESPQLHLALVHAPQRPQEARSNRHYGIELFEESTLATWLKSAKTFDLPLRVEENVTCCYAVANKFWARDPDGHDWEFWVRSAEAESMHGQHSQGTTQEGTRGAMAQAQTPAEQAPAACCAPGQCS